MAIIFLFCGAPNQALAAGGTLAPLQIYWTGLETNDTSKIQLHLDGHAQSLWGIGSLYLIYEGVDIGVATLPATGGSQDFKLAYSFEKFPANFVTDLRKNLITKIDLSGTEPLTGLRIDVEPPYIKIDAGTASGGTAPIVSNFTSAWEGENLKLSATVTASALSDISKVEIRSGGKFLKNATLSRIGRNASFTELIPFSDLPEVVKTQLRVGTPTNISILASDVVGNVTDAAHAEHPILKLPNQPTLAWQSLKNDAIYKPDVEWMQNYVISDGDLVDLQVEIDGDDESPMLVGTKGIHSVNLQPYLSAASSKLTHTIRLHSADVFGREIEVAGGVLTVQVDNAAPVITTFHSEWVGDDLKVSGTVTDALSPLKSLTIMVWDKVLKDVTVSGTDRSQAFDELIPFSRLPLSTKVLLRQGSSTAKILIHSADVLGNATVETQAMRQIAPLPPTATLVWKNFKSPAIFKPGSPWTQTYVVSGEELKDVIVEVNHTIIKLPGGGTIGEHVFDFTSHLEERNVIHIVGKDSYGRSVWIKEITALADDKAPVVEDFVSTWDGDNLKIRGSVVDALSDVKSLQYSEKGILKPITLAGVGKTRSFDIPIAIADLDNAEQLILTTTDVLDNVGAYTLKLNPFSVNALKLDLVLSNQQAITDGGGAFPKDDLIYQFTVEAVQNDMTGISVKFKLPAQLNATGVPQITVPHGSAPTSTWDGDSHQILIEGVALAKGEAMIILVPAKIKDAADLHDQYFVQASFVANATNIVSSVTVQHQQKIERVSPTWTPLQLIKKPDNVEIEPGVPLHYTITFKNRGTDPIENIIVTDMVKKETKFLGMWCGKDDQSTIGTIADHVKCKVIKPNVKSVEPGRVSWEMTGTLHPGESGVVSYQVRL